MPRPSTAAVRLLTGEREPVRLATTANLATVKVSGIWMISGGLQIIDGILTTPGARVLVKDQTDATLNGIYTASEGYWYRASDARTARTLQKGTTVAVQDGLANAGKVFWFNTLDPVIGTDDLSITVISIQDTASFVTFTGLQTLTNKTLTTPTLTLKQGATPTPTAEGDIQWDTDDNTIVVGDGAAQKTFWPSITGSWTPGLTFGGAAVGMTFSAQTGTYTTIGNMTFLVYNIALTAKGSSTGNALLTGFPVTVGNGAALIKAASNFTGLTGALWLDPNSGATTANFKQSGATGMTIISQSSFTDTTLFAGMMVIRTGS